MEYKVCILAAGKNNNVSYAKDFHIALLPIGTKSTLTKIIEKFPREVEIVIAVGHNSHLIKDFVKMAYDNRKITIVEIPNYSGPGSGPGRSLLMCKNYLQCPFIFTSADTVVSEPIPIPDKNWVGISQVSDSTNYCMAEVENDLATQFHVKVDTPTLLKTCKNYRTILNNAFIGMAGIYNHEDFWEGLEINQDLIDKELQVSNGLSELINKRIEAIPFFNWFDTGTEAGYNLANRFFERNKVIAKPDEFLYFEDSKVIKYFQDKEIIKQRVERSERLKGIVPEIVDKSDNFYSYNFIEGQTLAKVNDVNIFKQFLEFCKETVWKEEKLNQEETQEFESLCKKFYYDKTLERLQKLFTENGIKDQEEIINGETVPKISVLLSQIDWKKLFKGIPVVFHGDVQPENILVCKRGFQLIDWRHNFAGNTKFGDIYYDFAKLHHALIVTHEVIRKNQFEVKVNKGQINYDFVLKSNLLEYKDIFEKFVKDNGYDLDKLRILSALTFLNIAPLHHTPYKQFLYYLGKYTLFKELNHNNSYKLNTQENITPIN
jgi:thiamine kinase-like enzyme